MVSADMAHNSPPPSKALQVAVLLFFPLVAFVVGGIFLPSEKVVKKARAGVDREALSDVIVSELPALNQKINAVLNRKIAILGSVYPSAPLSRGSKIPIDTYFEVKDKLDRDWKIFMHIDRVKSSFRIHGDHFPTQGRYQTSFWQKGEIVKDSFAPRVPIDAPSGTYAIYLGFYIDKDRMRFTSGDKDAHDGDNRVKVGEITVQ